MGSVLAEKTNAGAEARNGADHGADIDGAGQMGITVFDGSREKRTPPHRIRHVRAYGLFAANNLFFKGGFTIQAGRSLTFSATV